MPRLNYGNETRDFLRPRSVDSSRCSTPPPDWCIDLLHMSTSHRCRETFTSCCLWNAYILSWLCLFTDACMVLTPWNLSDYIQRIANYNRHRLWSSLSSQQVIRHTQSSTVDNRAFLVAGSRLWNSLLPNVTSAPTLTIFWNHLKTYLFSGSFSSQPFAVSTSVHHLQ